MVHEVIVYVEYPTKLLTSRRRRFITIIYLYCHHAQFGVVITTYRFGFEVYKHIEILILKILEEIQLF